MKKIVIIGANDFQRPLIQKASEMGYETHVFAWRDGATGAADADEFYEISITEKQRILEICREIEPDAVATIGSDLANVTVQYLAEHLQLPGNSKECIVTSTNKFAMRNAFEKAGVPVPFYQVVKDGEKVEVPSFPVIVKPTDRSGSRAITKVEGPEELQEAIEKAVDQSFERCAIVEEYMEGEEYSVECISFQGTHTCLAVTKKFTTGAPNYIEVGHLEPAPISNQIRLEVEKTVSAALDALQVSCGASHSEVKIDKQGRVRIVEIGSRMGGDCIGSDLVHLSTGQDFVRMVVETSSGMKPEIKTAEQKVAAIRFLMCERDERHLQYLQETCPEVLKKVVVEGKIRDAKIVDSGSRPGFFIMQTETMDEMTKLLHGRLAMEPKVPGHPLIDKMVQEYYDCLVLEGEQMIGDMAAFEEIIRICDVPCYMIQDGEKMQETGAAVTDTGICRLTCPAEHRTLFAEELCEELAEMGYRPLHI